MNRRSQALAAIIFVALATASHAEEVSAADPLPMWPAFACFPDEGGEPFVVMAQGGEDPDIFSVSIAGSDKSAEFSVDARANMTLQSEDGFYVFSLGEVWGAAVWEANPPYTGLAFDGTNRAGNCISLATVRWNIMQANHGVSEAILLDAARSEIFQQRLAETQADLNAALARAAAEARKAEDELRLRLGLEDEVERLLQAEKERLERENQTLERYRSDFFGQLREVIEGREGVEIVGDRFVFSSVVLFPCDSADLSEEGRVSIAKVAPLLLDIQTQIPAEIDWIIRVDGHDDNIRLLPGGEFTDNWDLSQARALSVVRELVGYGLEPTRLSANGFGQFQPLNPANTAEARAQNCRVELKLTER